MLNILRSDMGKILILNLLLFLYAGTALAQQVTVIFNNSDKEQGELLGFNEQKLFLKDNGEIVEIPMKKIDSVIDVKKNMPIDLVPKMPLQKTRTNDLAETKKDVIIKSNISIQPLLLFPGLTVAELELATTDASSLSIRFINSGVLMDDWGLFPKKAYGFGLRYRFFLTEFLGQNRFSIGPTIEHASDIKVDYYWNAGVEFGYHFILGEYTKWIFRIALDSALEWAKKDGEISYEFRPGLNISFGVCFN